MLCDLLELWLGASNRHDGEEARHEQEDDRVSHFEWSERGLVFELSFWVRMGKSGRFRGPSAYS